MPEITSTVLPAPAHRVIAGISDRCEMTSVMSTGISPRAAHSIKLSAVDPPPDTSTAALNFRFDVLTRSQVRRRQSASVDS